MSTAPTAEILESFSGGISQEPKHLSTLRSALRTHPSMLLGLFVLMILIVVAVFAPVLAPYDIHQKVGPPYEPPSAQHWLGLDDAGIDMLSLMIWGARVSLLVGFTGALISMLIGGTIGLISGYFGGRTDQVLSRFTDYMLVIPAVPLMLVAAAVWGRSLLNIIIIIGLLGWTWTALIVRSQAKSLRNRGFVRRAHAVGSSDTRVIIRHVLPHLVPLQVAITVLAVADAIFAEAAIAFLGLGDPTLVSWGRLILNAFNGLAITVGAWWAIVPPGLAIMTVVIASTMLGRGMEESLNVKLRHGFSFTRGFRVKPESGA